MTIDEIIKIMQTEKTCVERASKNNCNRSCECCDLVLPSEMILEAYDAVLQMLKSQKNIMEAAEYYFTLDGGLWDEKTREAAAQVIKETVENPEKLKLFQ